MLREVIKHRWSTNKSHYGISNHGSRDTLHRVIMDFPDNNKVVDHINGDTYLNTLKKLKGNYSSR